ncbi:hypothetical protein MTYP_02595 [Methylophilaceae bacterium]|nr:hypothetical protein MTYP_02595 [Methylophilaceae bacterium]
MYIDPTNAINMLQKMGYSCEALNHVADLPEAVVEALHSAWHSLLEGDLQEWEIDLIVSRMQQAASTTQTH